MPIKVIAFDVFGTLVDASPAKPEDVRSYLAQIKRPEWAPLDLPEEWEHLPAFADSAEGIRRLCDKGFSVVTLSNFPRDLQAEMLANCGIEVHGIIPLERYLVYKPDHRAYATVIAELQVSLSEVLMVTANKTFGDLEAARSLGMQAQLINRRGDGEDSDPKTIIELAEQLGC